MHTVTTEWMTCGLRQRRAHLTTKTAELAQRAADYYVLVTQDAMSTVARIDRGVHIHKEFGATTRHEYNPE
jgi:hypothetical protein